MPTPEYNIPNLKKFNFLLFCILYSTSILSGCVLHGAKSYKNLSPNPSEKSHVFSVWPQNCNYFVFSLGTDKVAPNRTLELVNDFKEKTKDQKLSVKNYSIFLNSAEHMLRQSTSGGLAASGQFDYYLGGSKSGKNITLQPKCSRDEMTAGWFDPAELTNNISPLIIDLKVEYEGKEYSVYTVHSPDRELQYRYGKPDMVRNVNAAMAKAHETLVRTILAGDVDETPSFRF